MDKSGFGFKTTAIVFGQTQKQCRERQCKEHPQDPREPND